MLTCRHAGVCGGCSLLHLSYRDQLAAKASYLQRTLGGFVSLPHAFDRDRLFLADSSSSDGPAHFRHKVSFVFDTNPSNGSLVMGHHMRGSTRVVAVDECPVHSERGNQIAFALRDHLATSRIPAAGAGLDGILRHLIVRTTSDDREAVAMLVVARNDKALRRPIRAFLESADRPDGFFLNINSEPGPFMVGDQTIKLDGRSHVRETVSGVSHLISPTAFFQTNPAAAAVLQKYVVNSMSGARRVLDLYCGSGLFSLPIAMAGSYVTGIEENRQAIADAEANARLNKVPSSRARFRSHRLEDGLQRLGREEWDGVVLDPPRQGCSDAVLASVFQDLGPKRVTYVSCNADALAMELPGIVQCGYRVDEVRAVDMFPHTDHVEVVLRLSKA